MTNLEYLRKRTDGLGVNEGDLELILLKGWLVENDPADMTECDKALYNNWSVVKKSAAEKVREGGYSMERNLEALGSFYRSLGKEIGRHPLFGALGL